MNTEQKAGAEGGRVEGEGRLEERQGQGRAPARVGALRLEVRGILVMAIGRGVGWMEKAGSDPGVVVPGPMPRWEVR